MVLRPGYRGSAGSGHDCEQALKPVNKPRLGKVAGPADEVKYGDRWELLCVCIAAFAWGWGHVDWILRTAYFQPISGLDALCYALPST
jgi:hypothetical protein